MKCRLLSRCRHMRLVKLLALFVIISIEHGPDIFNSCKHQYDGGAGDADQEHAFQYSDQCGGEKIHGLPLSYRFCKSQTSIASRSNETSRLGNAPRFDLVQMFSQPAQDL